MYKKVATNVKNTNTEQQAIKKPVTKRKKGCGCASKRRRMED